MADIHTVNRKKGPDAIYIRQRYSADDGTTKQKKIRCADMAEARVLLPLIQEAENKGIPYIDTRPASYHGESTSSGRYGSPSTRYCDITVGELMPMFLKDAAGRGRFRPNTLKAKRGIVANHIIPYIGNIPIREIDTMFVQDYFDDLLTCDGAPGNHKTSPPKNSPRTVEEVKKILSPAFGYAITRLRAIKTNPITRDIIIPKTTTKKRDQWNYDELIEALASETDPQLKAIITMMPCETLRNCELFGLCWDCVHIPARITEENPAFIEIKRELLPTDLADNEATGYTPVFVFPNIQNDPKTRMCLFELTKTTKTRRIAYLPEGVVEILKAHRARQNEIKSSYGDGYHDYNLVFALEERYPGRPIANNTIRHYFDKFKENHGLRNVTFYSLRSSGVTQKLRILGFSPKVVQIDMGGDSDPVMMGHYAAAEDQDLRKFAVAVGKLLLLKNKNDETSQKKQDDTD